MLAWLPPEAQPTQSPGGADSSRPLNAALNPSVLCSSLGGLAAAWLPPLYSFMIILFSCPQMASTLPTSVQRGPRPWPSASRVGVGGWDGTDLGWGILDGNDSAPCTLDSNPSRAPVPSFAKNDNQSLRTPEDWLWLI